MKAATKAEIMLDQVTKSNRLINYLRFCKEHPIPPLRLDLRPSTKVSIKAYQDGVQNYIDRLTAQNEDAQNAAMKKNFFPVWASCPLWKPIWSGKVF